MKPIIALARVSCLLLVLLALLSLTSCAPKTVTYALDLVGTVQEKRLPRQELDNIAYQAREYVERHTRATFSRDFETAGDRLAYWVNAEMVDICGVITVKETLPDEEQPAQPSTPEIVGVRALITYESFAEAANAMQWRYVLADLVYKDARWEVKSAQEQADQSLTSAELTLNGEPALCLIRR